MEFYGIEDPLSLGARQFMIYTVNLPAASRLVHSLQDFDEAEDPLWYKTQMDAALGRNVNRRRLGVDQFVAGMG